MLFTGMKHKYAIIGGTFDPVHSGHLNLFHNLYIYCGVEKLYVIPALISNFKQDTHPASFDERIAMLRLASEDYHEMFPEDCMEIDVSDFEGRKGGISYTSETIKAFYDDLEESGRVNFAIGDDILPDLNRWHDFEYLKKNVHFICFTRDNANKKITHGADIEFIPSPVFEASSTEVRSGRLDLVSGRVREYINEHQLYRAL